jgi:ribosome biogenesis protein ENP2
VQILTEDYEKCVFLCMDRSLNFHAKGGAHFSARVPKCGRDLAYHSGCAEVVVGGSAAELWRVSLAQGRFMAPLELAAPAVNCLGISPAHGMLAAGCEGGTLQCFDLRQKEALGAINAAAALRAEGEDITALRFDPAGMYVATGTSQGKAAVFDLRRSAPLVVKEHMYDSAIVDLKFHVATGDHTGQQRVISADSHIVKVRARHTLPAHTSPTR